MAHNALRAAALRGLLVFVFAIRSHVHRPGLLCQPTAPALRLARLLAVEIIFLGHPVLHLLPHLPEIPPSHLIRVFAFLHTQYIFHP